MRLFLAGTVCLAPAAAQAQTQTEPEGPTGTDEIPDGPWRTNLIMRTTAGAADVGCCASNVDCQ